MVWKPPSLPDDPAIHRIDLPDQPAEAVLSALRAERADGEAAARSFIASCDRGDFEAALGEAIRGLRLNGESLPAFWADEIRGGAGALKHLQFAEPMLSRIVGEGEKTVAEPGRAALPVRYTGERSAVSLDVILAKSGSRWRVADLVLGAAQSSAEEGETPVPAP